MKNNGNSIKLITQITFGLILLVTLQSTNAGLGIRDPSFKSPSPGVYCGYYTSTIGISYKWKIDTAEFESNLFQHIPVQGGIVVPVGSRLELSGFPGFFLVMNFWDITMNLTLFSLGSEERFSRVRLGIGANSTGYANIASDFGYFFTSAGYFLSLSGITIFGWMNFSLTQSVLQTYNSELINLEKSLIVNGKVRWLVTDIGASVEINGAEDVSASFGIAYLYPFASYGWYRHDSTTDPDVRFTRSTGAISFRFGIGLALNGRPRK